MRNKSNTQIREQWIINLWTVYNKLWLEEINFNQDWEIFLVSLLSSERNKSWAYWKYKFRFKICEDGCFLSVKKEGGGEGTTMIYDWQIGNDFMEVLYAYINEYNLLSVHMVHTDAWLCELLWIMSMEEVDNIVSEYVKELDLDNNPPEYIRDFFDRIHSYKRVVMDWIRWSFHNAVLFHYIWTTCVRSWIEGSYWVFSRDKGNMKHLDLYTTEGFLMTIDHIVPISKGGWNELSNLQPMIHYHNQEKWSDDEEA